MRNRYAISSPDSVDWGNPINWSHPLKSGLISWWRAVPNRLGFGTTKWRDMVQKTSNHGTVTGLSGGTSWTGPKARRGGWGSFTLDGVDDFVTVSNLDRNTFSFLAWIRRTTAVASDRLILARTNGGWGIVWDASDKVIFTKVGISNATSTGSLSAGTEWRHLAITYDGATTRYYFDGLLDSEPAYAVTFDSSGGVYDIGSRNGDQFLTASIDDLLFYNRVVSAAEVWSIRQLSQQFYPGAFNRISMTEYAPAGGISELINGGLVNQHGLVNGELVAA